LWEEVGGGGGVSVESLLWRHERHVERFDVDGNLVCAECGVIVKEA